MILFTFSLRAASKEQEEQTGQRARDEKVKERAKRREEKQERTEIGGRGKQFKE
jgi:hypothetical protein